MRSGPPSAGRLAAVCCTLVLVAACGQSDTGQSLSNLVLSQAPAGYTNQPIGGGGTMSIDDAASATPADPGAVRSFLQTSTWNGAFARVWVRGTDYAEDLGYGFASSADALRFARLEVSALQAATGNYVYPLAQVPAAQAFIIYSQTRVGGHNVFCNGVWFPVQTRVFELLTCGSMPQDGQLAAKLAVAQYAAVGGAPASVAPS